MKVAIIGTGYVGLVSGACLAEKGHEVACVDLDERKIECLNRGEVPIYERGLEDLLKANLGRRFRATTNLRGAVLQSDLTMIAVGTPMGRERIELKFVRAVSQQIGEVLREKSAYHTVVVKSTVVPGTTDEVVTSLLEAASGKRAGTDFGVGMNPEFLREGEAVEDFMNPDRIVLGGIDERTFEVLEELYRPFSGVDKFRTNPRTAEAIKYAANALLATTISFSNEIGNLCAEIGGIDIVDVMKGVSLDKRLSPILDGGRRITPGFMTYLAAGCGFGGSCFPKDIKALISHGRQAGCPMRILEAVVSVNRDQPQRVLALLKEHYPEIAGLRVAVLGLAFKPGTDDMRESPAIPIVRGLLADKALVTAFDPVAERTASEVFGEEALDFAPTLAEAVEGADAVLLLTRWPEFEALPHMLSSLADPPLLIDGRRMLDRREISRYAGIGLRGSGPSAKTAPEV